MSYSFVIQKDHFEILKELGQKEAPNEVGAFLLAQKIDSRLSTRLVARELVLFEPDNLSSPVFFARQPPKPSPDS